MLDYLLFVVFPYIAITSFIFGTFYRFYNDKYSMSSQSSQFLGSKRSLIVGSLLWHWGIIMILTMHFTGIFFPDFFNRIVTSDNREQWEWAGWVIATALIIGLSILLVRRIINPRLRVVTTTADWIIISLLLIQAIFGLYIAFYLAYYDPVILNDGDPVYASSWFTITVGTWLTSLAAFNPQISGVTGLNWVLQFHFLNGMLIIAIFPFTRLMHIVSYPFRYIWRSYQVVIFNRPAYSRDDQWDK